jgi:eukaryotic-like serine/threonine-protein kinase
MTPERWQMVRGILQSAMELRPQERDAFLDRECASDPTLRKDVDEMLSAERKLDPEFLESPAAVEFPAGPFASTSVLAAGTRLGNYELRALLGAGGMGQVYRARDLQLKREVAIKIIPRFYSSDPARQHRFKQEAEATAALNHPNILTVYQVGQEDTTFYIVAELLQGETLRDRLKGGPLPLRAATDYAVQIARGLAVAHESGVIHRDLKPENIFVTKDGRIKILDFGLAKLIEPPPEGRANDEKIKSTATQWTEPGLVLGTTAYMSPEQVRGSRVGHHSDIFAFGAVLYEMLSGHLAFAKGTAAETMTAILNEDPPSLSQSGKSISPGLQRVILRCLEKKPEQRFQSASDLAFALEALSDPSDSGALAMIPAKRLPWAWILGAAGTVGVAAAVLFWLHLPPAVPVVESITQITDDGAPKFGVFTDGSRIYFSEGESGATHLAQVSAFGGSTAPLENAPPNAGIMQVAPDGSAMLLQLGNKDIALLPLPAGEPRRILDGQKTDSVDFLPDGNLVYSTHSLQSQADLMIAERDGRNARKVKSFPVPFEIQVSPDGRRLLICLHHQEGCTLQSIARDGSDAVRIGDFPDAETGSIAWNHNGKYALYDRKSKGQSDIWAAPVPSGWFHRSSHVVQLTSGPLSYAAASPSPDGKRIFTVGTKSRAEMVRYDPNTRQFSPYFPGLSTIETQFSQDGEWMAYLSLPDTSLWRCRIDGSERLQLTFPPMNVMFPRFAPDGKKIAFGSADGAMYVVDMAGGQPRKLADSGRGPEWSPDGGSLVFGDFVGSNLPGVLTRLMNLATGRISDIPGSSGIGGAHFVNAGTLVAFNFNTNKFVTFDFSSTRWSDLAALPSVAHSWQLSRDRKFLFYTVGAQRFQVQRVSLATRKVEDVTELKGFHQAASPTSGVWDFSVAPDGSLIFSRDISSQEIYALNVRWP